MSLSTKPYKGARDFYPEDKRLQQWMFDKWRGVVQRFGYEQYDAPILEPTGLYASKTSDEIVNEQTYTFKDRGERSVTIRTEMTPSVTRMVADRRQELAYPLRLYSIPNMWRYERPQKGRLREFWQLNVDLFGVSSIEAEFEMIVMSDQLMKSFGAKPQMYQIKINSRKLVNALLQDYCGLDDVQTETMIRLIDKSKKIEAHEFNAKVDAVLHQGQRESGVQAKLHELLAIQRLDDLPEQIASHQSVQTMRQLIEFAGEASISNVTFDMTLMRGFDYYTDIIFEVFDNHPDNNRSMFGGGRYDGLLSEFGVEPLPTIGFGMGDVTLYNFLVVHNLMPHLSTETDIYAAIVTDNTKAVTKVLKSLREMKVNVAADYSGRKLEKQIKTAVKKQIPYLFIIGDDELAEDSYTIKNLRTKEEERHSLQRVVSIVKDYRTR